MVVGISFVINLYKPSERKLKQMFKPYYCFYEINPPNQNLILLCKRPVEFLNITLCGKIYRDRKMLIVKNIS